MVYLVTAIFEGNTGVDLLKPLQGDTFDTFTWVKRGRYDPAGHGTLHETSSNTQTACVEQLRALSLYKDQRDDPIVQSWVQFERFQRQSGQIS